MIKSVAPLLRSRRGRLAPHFRAQHAIGTAGGAADSIALADYYSFTAIPKVFILR